MKYYVVIDTNVLVSALLRWNSVPGSILELAFDGPIIPILSKEIIAEYQEVLRRPKFHFTTAVIDDIMESMIQKGIFIDAEILDIEMPDPKDRVFYEVVMEARKRDEAYLTTGNIKHFPNQSFIVTPREMLDIILAGNL